MKKNKKINNKYIENKPLVSIVTVVFNGEEYIEQTIKSVINQTYKNIEYIIIDGASSDKTVDIIKKYVKEIDFWISEEDNGIYYAMNKGIDISSGDWCIFMNAGDTFSSNNVLSKVFEQVNEGFLYFGRIKIGGDNSNKLIPNKRINSANISNWLKNHEPNHQAIFFPKSFYKRNHYNISFRISSDYDYKLKALEECQYKFVDTIIANFLLGGISTFPSLDNLKKQYIERHIINKKHSKKSLKLFHLLKAYIKFYIFKFKVYILGNN